MATMREFTFPSSDGTHSVGAVWWLPDEGAPRAVVQLVHGISEYIGRYAPFARYLTDHGFAVVGHDHLGHGRTAKGREEYGLVCGTGRLEIRAQRYAHPAAAGRGGVSRPALFYPGPFHGSFVTRGYLMFYPGTVDGAILSGTGQESAATVAAGRVLSALLCRLRGAAPAAGCSTPCPSGRTTGNFRPTAPAPTGSAQTKRW